MYLSNGGKIQLLLHRRNIQLHQWSHFLGDITCSRGISHCTETSFFYPHKAISSLCICCLNTIEQLIHNMTKAAWKQTYSLVLISIQMFPLGLADQPSTKTWLPRLHPWKLMICPQTCPCSNEAVSQVQVKSGGRSCLFPFAIKPFSLFC